MGIVAFCPNGHRIKVKDEFAGRKGICPTCAAKFRIPDAAPPSAPDRSAVNPVGLPTARVVSLDPLFTASLPAAFALEPNDAGAAIARESEPADDRSDFMEVDDDVGAAGPAPSPSASHSMLDERPDLAWCVAVRGGAPSAPLDAAAMRTWLDSGAATTDTVVWRSDWPDWRPLEEVFPEALPPGPPGWP